MKKKLMLCAVLMLMMGLIGCGTPEAEQPEEQIDYEIAMVTDSGLIMDGGYSEVTWTAISKFGAEKGMSHKYYKAADASAESYQTTIDNAVAKGAKVIVADGYSFEDAVYNAQSAYEDVKFILIDAEPMDAASGKVKIMENTVAVQFSSEQAGYLAGYAAVKEGMTQLGFIGDTKAPMIMDYGYGFLQGAETAAAESELEINVRYHYCTAEEEREMILSRASQWYEDGTEVIMVCGTRVEMPVIEAAELTDKKVIGCETDKSQMSDTMITSAVKDLDSALLNVLGLYAADKFPGGEIIVYNAKNGGIWLEMDNARLESFTDADYKLLYDEMTAGNLRVMEHSVGDIEALELEKVIVAEE